MENIYDKLGQMGTEETFHGFWCGEEVTFPRVFRGYRFTDEECIGLCYGETIEVHNIDGKCGKYGVRGKLAKSKWFGEIRFEAEDVLLNNPDYRYEKGGVAPVISKKDEAYNGYAVVEEQEEDVALTDEDLYGISFTETYEEPIPVLDESMSFAEEDIQNETDDGLWEDGDEEDDTDGFLLIPDEEDDYDYEDDEDINDDLDFDMDVEKEEEEQSSNQPDDFDDSEYDDIPYEEFIPNFHNPPIDCKYAPDEEVE